jgi:hypothetical protein
VAQIAEDKYQAIDRSWLECMMRIGRKETAYFEQDNVGYTDQLFWYHSRRQVMRWVYSTMVTAKKITPIENLELEVKKQMWGFINELCVGKEVSKDIRIDIARIFYLIEYFINENKL